MTFPLSRQKEWLVLVPAMTVPFIAALFYFRLFSDQPVAKFIYVAVKLFNLSWPLIGSYLFITAWIPSFSLRESRHRRAIPLGLLSGLMIVAIMVLGLATPIGQAVSSSTGRIRVKVAELGIIDHYILFSIFLSFFHSLLEEYYWRWFVFGNLCQLIRPIWANLLSALAFAAHHVIVLHEYFPLRWALFFGASVAVGGVIWNTMYAKQRTLAGAWVSHLLVDLGIMTIGYVILFVP